MSWNDLRKGRFSQSQREYFVTFNCLNKKSLFYDANIAHQFCKHIELNEEKHGCTWLTWVLMPDHFHGLLKLGENGSQLSTVVAELKGATAYAINQALSSRGKVWQSSFYDRALRQEDDRKSIARYIVANPLRKGIVENIGDYPFWNSIYL